MSDDPKPDAGCDAKPRRRPGLQVLAWVCPMCGGSGRWSEGERCMECVGYGLVAQRPDPAAWGAANVRRAPRPPAVMEAACRDCAYRAGAPEEETPPPADRPFFCHHGCQPTDDGYTAQVTFDGLPIGEKICAGWWFTVTGQGEAPGRPFADTHPRRHGSGERDPAS